mmetsp:Transcript_10802/g.26955  ORF Transcript_10802/g.26955 Transcript_10802/m.26955 type:complete len:205 (+) Transcript_10802:351-965(+)
MRFTLSCIMPLSWSTCCLTSVVLSWLPASLYVFMRSRINFLRGVERAPGLASLRISSPCEFLTLSASSRSIWSATRSGYWASRTPATTIHKACASAKAWRTPSHSRHSAFSLQPGYAVLALSKMDVSAPSKPFFSSLSALLSKQVAKVAWSRSLTTPRKATAPSVISQPRPCAANPTATRVSERKEPLAKRSGTRQLPRAALTT